jgi:hypothetical protein
MQSARLKYGLERQMAQRWVALRFFVAGIIATLIAFTLENYKRTHIWPDGFNFKDLSETYPFKALGIDTGTIILGIDFLTGFFLTYLIIYSFEWFFALKYVGVKWLDFVLVSMLASFIFPFMFFNMLQATVFGLGFGLLQFIALRSKVRKAYIWIAVTGLAYFALAAWGFFYYPVVYDWLKTRSLEQWLVSLRGLDTLTIVIAFQTFGLLFMRPKDKPSR